MLAIFIGGMCAGILILIFADLITIKRKTEEIKKEAIKNEQKIRYDRITDSDIDCHIPRID